MIFGLTLAMVGLSDRVITLEDGKIVKEERPGEFTRA